MLEKTSPSKTVILNGSQSCDCINRELITVLRQEADSIKYLVDNFPIKSEKLVKKILDTKGRVVFSGMGKSGLVAKKLVATFSSIGTPSFFLHPSEALHGDLGMLCKDDLFIAISKSGTGFELEQVISILNSQGNYTSLICCSSGALAEIVDLAIVLPFTREACQLNLAPTSSSTLTMAFGDALGVVVSKLKKFGKSDFARFHPAGALGKRLLLKVSSFAYKQEQLPLMSPTLDFANTLLLISSKKLGVGIVVDDDKKVLGVITDGDLRRASEKGKEVFYQTAREIMNINPKKAKMDDLAYDSLCAMEKFNITSLIITDEQNVILGLIHIHDLIKAGLA